MALIQEYNCLLMHNEDQLQFLMQIVTGMGMLFLTVKRLHYLLGNNEWGKTRDTPAC